ncbi:MAG: lysophospholipid acyltransferase family protein [candidate division Zixibacteria bacterium]|nr:lysophospholipid acyltransferase family protein [candidate division Zixibacteria bacterium]
MADPADFSATTDIPANPSASLFAKRLKNTLIYYGVYGFVRLIDATPRPLALDLCGALALAAYLSARSVRRRTLDNLGHAFGKTLTSTQIGLLGREVFWHLGRNAADAARRPDTGEDGLDTLVRATGLDRLDTALRQGRGVLAVSGHIGNFELLGRYLAYKGYGVTVVAAALYDSRLDTLLRDRRSAGGLHVVYRDRATTAVLRALRKGHVVGLLVDQDTRVPSVFVPFFDRPAYTPVGPAVLAERTGAPIVPMAIRRLPDDTHLITIEPPLPSGLSVEETVRRYTSAIERFIREDPAEWVWMHDRWKTKVEK